MLTLDELKEARRLLLLSRDGIDRALEHIATAIDIEHRRVQQQARLHTIVAIAKAQRVPS